MQIELTALTHTGQRRTNNEDSIALHDEVLTDSVQPAIRRSRPLGDGPLVVLVADGIGGHRAGEVASRLVAEQLVRLLSTARDEHEVADGVRAVNQQVYAAMRESPEYCGMGSTVVGLCLWPGLALCFNVGDSRVYRLQSGCLELLSRDDSPDFQPGWSQQPPRPKTGIITQSLGGGADWVEVDPHLRRARLRPGELFLLCSDGLSDMLDLDALEAALTVGDDAAVVNHLFEQAMAAGGRDNISIVLVRAVGDNA